MNALGEVRFDRGGLGSKGDTTVLKGEKSTASGVYVSYS